MMKYVLLLVALCAVLAQAVPAPSPDSDEGSLYYPGGRPNRPMIPPFYMGEPACTYKCGLKCYRMGFYNGNCQSGMCQCYGSSYDYGYLPFF